MQLSLKMCTHKICAYTSGMINYNKSILYSYKANGICAPFPNATRPIVAKDKNGCKNILKVVGQALQNRKVPSSDTVMELFNYSFFRSFVCVFVFVFVLWH